MDDNLNFKTSGFVWYKCITTLKFKNTKKNNCYDSKEYLRDKFSSLKYNEKS